LHASAHVYLLEGSGGMRRRAVWTKDSTATGAGKRAPAETGLIASARWPGVMSALRSHHGHLCSKPLLNCLPAIVMHRWLYKRERSHVRTKSKDSSSRSGGRAVIGGGSATDLACGGPVLQHNKSPPHANASALGPSVAP